MLIKILPHGRRVAILESDTHVSKWVIENGRLDHDQNMLPLLDPYLGGGVVDIGAFIGDHTEYYAERASHVFAFEPNADAHDCLKYNMYDKYNVTCIHVALGDKEGTASILENINAGMASLIEGDQVRVCTLDSYSLTDISFIKVDVEGCECEVLEGAKDTIRRCRPTMLIEVNEEALKRQGHTPAELLTKIETLQYVMRNIYEGQPMRGPQYDILCTPLF